MSRAAARSGTIAHVPRNMHLPRGVAGVLSAFEFVAMYIAWADSHLNEPTIDQIRDRWDVCRATAYRWRAAWRRFSERRAALADRFGGGV